MAPSLRACQAVHEHPADKIIHGIRHSFESSSTIRVSCEFALLSGYLLQSSHQEHPPVYAANTGHLRVHRVRKQKRTLVWVHIFVSLRIIPVILLPLFELIIDGPEIGLQFWVDVAKRCFGIELVRVCAGNDPRGAAGWAF